MKGIDMYWKITAYNGTTWTSSYGMPLDEAISTFLSNNKLCQVDIKFVENMS
jgi:hypothetical protein